MAFPLNVFQHVSVMQLKSSYIINKMQSKTYNLINVSKFRLLRAKTLIIGDTKYN